MTWSRLLGTAVGFAALAITSWPAAVSAAPADDRQPAHEQYFLDFRSRAGYVFGHTYIAYGRLSNRGQPLETRYAGIYPRRRRARPDFRIGDASRCIGSRPR